MIARYAHSSIAKKASKDLSNYLELIQSDGKPNALHPTRRKAKKSRKIKPSSQLLTLPQTHIPEHILNFLAFTYAGAATQEAAARTDNGLCLHEEDTIVWFKTEASRKPHLYV